MVASSLASSSNSRVSHSTSQSTPSSSSSLTSLSMASPSFATLLSPPPLTAITPHYKGLSLLSKIIDLNYGNLCNGICELYTNNKAKLKVAALEAANNFHAPYGRCPSRVALMDCEWKICRGSCMESVAYNPNLGPLQVALVAYVASGGGSGYDRIVATALMEREGVVVRLLLKMVSPQCEFRVFHCPIGF
ncbi:hypothetical protein F0562_006121 [Nyssa sinensis]|uniref:CMP/dCMP-type deaminase domain-containing protein n=1 Tax=Nyssa sinensis TaxID=561372 RepID=A0A5J5AP77_9ASTE|nr:hypothetical protein F0562_006121 [Nyssa sinensis]